MDERVQYRKLLEEASLPTDDFDQIPDEDMTVVTNEGDAVIAGACIQVSVSDAAALLRSVVVAPDHRRRGLGRQVVERAEGLAGRRGAKRLYLLTETAPEYFERFGYAPTPRDTLPARIAALPEATNLCPDTAMCMTKFLKERRMEKLNIGDRLSRLGEFWSQDVLAEANGTLIKVAKGLGATRWHAHNDQDEVFIVQRGRLDIQLPDGTIPLEAGEMYVVPRGVEHAPKAEEPTEFIIMGRSVTSTTEGGKPTTDLDLQGGAP